MKRQKIKTTEAEARKRFFIDWIFIHHEYGRRMYLFVQRPTKKISPIMTRKIMKILKVNFEGSVKHQEPNQTPLLKT